MKSITKLYLATTILAVGALATPALAQTSRDSDTRNGYSNEVTGTVPGNSPAMRNRSADPDAFITSPQERQQERGSALVDHPDDGMPHDRR